ncbi:hypothetical protein [uncultured Tenacibaculum sp.]|uniref:hypothetical protein n=1 Tax=uncultured Tenacibaculum sp. TaxID=174713 RepID=UPI002633A00D|nr:hypothetical protein [uncultured Tenacibaculum sp.]
MKISNFKTQLGDISLNLHSNKDGEITNSESGYIFQSDSFRVEIIEFTEIKNWLKEVSEIEIQSSIGWIFRITKLNDNNETLNFDCSLERTSTEITSEPDTGENLQAIWIEDKKNVVSIGTEDGEMMRYRAEKNDWMPNRLKSELGIIKTGSFLNQKNQEKSFTKQLPFGFETKIPKLKKGEKLYFHYLVATNELKKSIDYPDEYDISTNFAVDYPKWTLIEKLNLKE